MADPVSDAIDDLQSKMETVSAIRNRAIYVYDQEDLLNTEKQIKTPCAGVLYVGMAINEEDTRREKAVLLTAQVAFIGGDFCELPNSQVKEKTTKILDDIRRAVIAPPTSATQLVWRFESEAPFEINRQGGDKLIGYVQSWTTPIIINETAPYQ